MPMNALESLLALPPLQIVAAFAVPFISVGLRGFQHKNAEGNHYKLVFVTACGINVADMVSVGLVVKNGLVIAIPGSLGAATGMTLALWLHNKFVKRKK